MAACSIYRRERMRACRLAAEGARLPNGIVMANNGANLWIGEFALKRITSVRLAGQPPMTSTSPAWWRRRRVAMGPDGMLLRPDGILLAANFRAGEVLAWDPAGRPLGAIRLPADAGLMTTNIAIRGQWLYITEASKGEIWRVRLIK